jgi:hypothetical protein
MAPAPLCPWIHLVKKTFEGREDIRKIEADAPSVAETVAAN